MQQPHPPLWVAVSAPGTELDAADRDMGALALSSADIESRDSWLPDVRDARDL